jgi:hypothetical protein
MQRRSNGPTQECLLAGAGGDSFIAMSNLRLRQFAAEHAASSLWASMLNRLKCGLPTASENALVRGVPAEEDDEDEEEQGEDDDEGDEDEAEGYSE